MNTALATVSPANALEHALIMGNLNALTVDQRLAYYKSVCESVGLNPLTRPFDYLSLNGKLVLYAKRDATDQLRKIHGVSVYKLDSQRIEDVYVVTAYVRDKAGREDSSTGAVTIGAIKGDALANALMKAETKAKRRATLSICGLGLLDETEIGTIPDAKIPPTMEELKAGADQYELESPNKEILAKVEEASQSGSNEQETVSQTKKPLTRITVVVTKVAVDKAKTFLKLEAFDKDSREYTLFSWHKNTQHAHLLGAEQRECEFSTSEGMKGNKPFVAIEEIHRIGKVLYKDNQPVKPDFVPDAAELGFDRPEE